MPESLIDAMTDALAHRGPDGRGVFRDRRWGLALGHRRLAIIDREGGAQPMASPCGRYVLVFNGEIYNYADLKRELIAEGETIRTQSDTEVLLCWLARHGIAGIDRLNGMFALAFADTRERSLLLARDPTGEKPLYYRDDGDCFAFASEVKSLLLMPGVRREIDPESLHHYLSLNYVPGERTMIAGIRRCPPGYALIVRGGRMTRTRHYEKRPEAPPRTLDAAADRFEELLNDAVRLRLRSDVPVGMFLSSGLDSSLIASSVARLGAPVTAYSVAFDDPRFDESAAAEETAGRLRLRFHRERVSDAAECSIEQIVYHADDPLADSSAVPTLRLCRAVSRHCKVALGGDGADELFAGYLTHRATLLVRRYRRWLPAGLRRVLAAAVREMPVGGGKVSLRYKLRRFFERADVAGAHLAFSGTWLEREKRDLYDSAWERRVAGLDSFAQLAAGLGLHEESHGVQGILDADQRQYLPDDILVKTDRMSMACGLEVRSPYLDRRLVDLAAGLPAEMLLGLRQGKRLMRHVARRRGLTNVARRRKQGFSVPIHAWLRGPMRGAMLNSLAASRLRATGIFNPAAVRDRIDRHLAGRDDLGFELWGLMTFMAWWELFIEQPIETMPATLPGDVLNGLTVASPLVGDAAARGRRTLELAGSSVE